MEMKKNQQISHYVYILGCQIQIVEKSVWFVFILSIW